MVLFNDQQRTGSDTFKAQDANALAVDLYASGRSCPFHEFLRHCGAVDEKIVRACREQHRRLPAVAERVTVEPISVLVLCKAGRACVQDASRGQACNGVGAETAPVGPPRRHAGCQSGRPPGRPSAPCRVAASASAALPHAGTNMPPNVSIMDMWEHVRSTDRGWMPPCGAHAGESAALRAQCAGAALVIGRPPAHLGPLPLCTALQDAAPTCPVSART